MLISQRQLLFLLDVEAGDGDEEPPLPGLSLKQATRHYLSTWKAVVNKGWVKLTKNRVTLTYKGKAVIYGMTDTNIISTLEVKSWGDDRRVAVLKDRWKGRIKP